MLPRLTHRKHTKVWVRIGWLWVAGFVGWRLSDTDCYPLHAVWRCVPGLDMRRRRWRLGALLHSLFAFVPLAKAKVRWSMSLEKGQYLLKLRWTAHIRNTGVRVGVLSSCHINQPRVHYFNGFKTSDLWRAGDINVNDKC